MSYSRAFLKPLFLTFDVWNLNCSGASLIPSSTSFLPNSEFSVLAPTPSPFFNRPVDASALTPTFGMFAKNILTCCVLRFLCLVGPVCQALAMVTFLSETFLLTLSYLVRKDCPFGNVAQCGVKRRLNNIFCLCIFFDPNIAPTSKNPPFCLCFLDLLPMYPRLTDRFSFLKVIVFL